MRIVMVATGSPPAPFGGVGVYIEGLLGGMEAHSTDVHLVGASRHRGLPRVYRHGGATVRRVLATLPWVRAPLPRSRLGMAVALARLNITGAWYVRRLHARKKVDLVAVHDWMCAPVGLVCALLFRLPVCYHVHSAEIFHGDGSRGAVAALGRTLSRALARHARLIMAPSSATVAAVPHLAGRSDVAVVSHGSGRAWQMECPHGAERAAVRDKVRSLYGIPDGRRLVMFAGRYAAIKGVTQLVEAVRRILDDGVDVTLVMAGTGWPETSLDRRLRERVARLGLGERVHVLGRYLDPDELRDHLVAADACAFPSEYESCGFAALEAMALRARTVVGPGFDEAVVGSTEGACLRTATTDPGELASALLRLLGDDDPDLGDRARRYVLGRRTWARAATRTLEAYARAVRR
ncbi:glycosyltransferase family 4 protein [Actinomadura sp. 7K534]|uniref:glycosyltransferase family 4 protein n=1 Tax=Actinomadura sp. 7K534 TaxID=2530366 RepID=UPI00104670D5|nr:glycosyltransferase family 4 protein [Actinomadura sp. 7K534]TDB94050.1 glycosyltransferase family 1 protein [Actinomadura sp. 7K534]